MVHTVLIEPSTPDEDQTSHLQCILSKFRGYTALLRLMCLRFDSNDCAFTRIKNNIFVSVLLITSIYVVCFDTYTIARNLDVEYGITGIVMIIWNAQSIVTIIFLTKWQKFQAFRSFFNNLHDAQMEEDVYAKERARCLLRNQCVFCVLNITMFLLIAHFLFITITGNDIQVLNPELQNVFYHRELRSIRLIQHIVNFTSWNICIHCYVALTYGVYWEVKTYNWKVRNVSPKSAEDLQLQLLILIRQHSKLSVAVRSLDKIFTAYAFIMISSIIPTFLFTLITQVTRKTVYDFLLTLPSAAFCLYGYYGLTAAPAKLHSELFKSKAILCANEKVWIPFDRDANQLAQTLSIHMDQTDLGISIWGFALVSKPLILTTFSAMITFLALLLEFKP